MQKYSHARFLELAHNVTARKLKEEFKKRGQYVALNTLYLWKNGTAEPTKIKYLALLADIFGKEIQYFFVSSVAPYSMYNTDASCGSSFQSLHTECGKNNE